MITFRRLLWSLGAIVCLAVLVAGCGPSPSGTEELVPTSEVIPGTNQLSATPEEAPQTPPVAASASPALTPTRAISSDDESREMRLTPVGTLIAEPVPTLGGEAVIGEVPEDLLEAILADAAERTGLPPEAFTVVRGETVTWSDSSLGCPQPGQVYAQVVTPGYLVIVEAAAEAHEYHTDRERTVVHCEEQKMTGSPTAVSPAASGLEKLVNIAKEDLAQRLSIEPAQIDLVEVKAVVWPDGGLGCPEPGVAYTQIQVEGTLIRLRVGKRVYQYHSGGGRPPFLCEHPVGSSDSLSSPGLADD